MCFNNKCCSPKLLRKLWCWLKGVCDRLMLMWRWYNECMLRHIARQVWNSKWYFLVICGIVVNWSTWIHVTTVRYCILESPFQTTFEIHLVLSVHFTASLHVYHIYLQLFNWFKKKWMQIVYDAADRCSTGCAVIFCYCGEQLWLTVFTIPAAGHRLKTGVASFVIENMCIVHWSCGNIGCSLHFGHHRHQFIFSKSLVTITHDCFASLSTFMLVSYCLSNMSVCIWKYSKEATLQGKAFKFL
jgi:hypothetical protein